MPRAAAHRRDKARPSRRAGAAVPPRWPVFVLGCAVGASATFLADSLDLRSLSGGGAGSDTVAEGAPPPLPSKPRFDFYTILPEMEVVLPPLPEIAAPAAVPVPERTPEEAAPDTQAVAALEAGGAQVLPVRAPEPAPSSPAPSPPAPAAAKPAAGAVEPGDAYILQVGSFRRAGEAERMRASLALLGLESVVQTIAIDGEATWHRVRVGPYTELAAFNDARVRLRENRIEAMAMKVRAP